MGGAKKDDSKMKITPEESEAYNKAETFKGAYEWAMTFDNLRISLRRHVVAEMRLEFEKEHATWQGLCAVCVKLVDYDPRHGYDAAAWLQAADVALRGGKADG